MQPTVPVSLQVSVVQVQGALDVSGARSVTLTAMPRDALRGQGGLGDVGGLAPLPIAFYVTIAINDPELLDNFALGQDLIVTVAAAG
jgi:hypothetical protein